MKSPVFIQFAHAKALAICAIIATAVSILAFASADSTMRTGPSISETHAVLLASLSTGTERTTPSKGVFLIASRNIRDPRFMETVIFLISQDENGAMGVIINRPTKLNLSQALPGIKGNDFIYAGGPVAFDQLLMLVRSGSPPEKALHLFDNVYISSDTNYLEHMINEPKGYERFRVYAGYAGWGPGQLEREISRSDWLATEAGSDLIFDKEASSVWHELIEKNDAIEVMNRESATQQSFSGLQQRS